METNTITYLLLSLLFWLFVVCCLFLIRMFVVRRFCAFVVFVAFLVFVVCCLRRCCRRCCRRRCCCCRCFGGECAGNFDEFCTMQVKSLSPLFFGGLPFPTARVKTGAFVQAESFFGVKLNYHHSKYETLFQTLLMTETWLQAKQTRHAKRFDGAPSGSVLFVSMTRRWGPSYCVSHECLNGPVNFWRRNKEVNFISFDMPRPQDAARNSARAGLWLQIRWDPLNPATTSMALLQMITSLGALAAPVDASSKLCLGTITKPHKSLCPIRSI